jgi:hypothetical protein
MHPRSVFSIHGHFTPRERLAWLVEGGHPSSSPYHAQANVPIYTHLSFNHSYSHTGIFIGKSVRWIFIILMYLSFVLILEKLYWTVKMDFLYLFLILLRWKKAQKSLISWLKFWHFSCHLKVRFIYFTFKTSVEVTQKIFFLSDNSYTKAHCFYFYVTKRLGSVIKNSVQGESSWPMFWCIHLSFSKMSDGLIRFWHGNANIF